MPNTPLKGYTSGAIDYLFKPLDPFITSAKVDSFIQLAKIQAEIRLKNEELQNYALVIKNSADIICSVDAQTLRIQTINPAVEKILGFKPEELLDKNIVDFAVYEERYAFAEKLAEIVKDNLTSSVFEFKFATFNKSVIWAECRAAYQNKIYIFKYKRYIATKKLSKSTH